MRNADNMTATARLDPKSAHQSLLGNLRTPGLLGKYPIIGVIMVLLGCSLFGVLAISLQTHSPLLLTDTQIVNSLHETALQSPLFVRDIMIFGFYLGEHGILLIGVVLGLYFLYKRFWLELSMVIIAWAGEGALWLFLSDHFNRARPVFAVSIWQPITGPGFPSGHSFSAVMCYGLLAYLLVPRMPSLFWKIVISIGAFLIIVYIGFSRVFVGQHFPIDVLAGYGLGIAWSGFVYTSLELIFTRKKQSETA